MTRNERIILGIALFLTILFFAPVASVYKSMTTDTMGWQAGVSNESILAWAAAILIGYGYLLFQNLLMVFAMIFIKKSRRAAFWLLCLPGFLGILLGLLWLGLFIKFDPEFPTSLPLNMVLLTSPVATFIVGRRIRKRHKK